MHFVGFEAGISFAHYWLLYSLFFFCQPLHLNPYLSSKELVAEFGSSIGTGAYQAGTGGDITVNAGSISMGGSLSTGNISLGGSIIGTEAAFNTQGGNINIFSDNITINDGAAISAATLGAGKSGKLAINTSNIFISGARELFTNGLLFSAVTTSSLGEGDAGDVNVSADRVSILDGSYIGSLSFFEGNSGTVSVQASDSIKIDGSVPNELAINFQAIGRENANNSSINSVVLPVNPKAFSSVSIPLNRQTTGDSGDVIVSTDRLNVTNSGDISVANLGSGKGGDVLIEARSAKFGHGGTITAATASGDGGNITLKANSLRLRDDSFISATAGSAGDGGNITINADTIVGTGNSDITANASQGRGGQIEINTEGIFGLFVRDELTPFNDITAFSEAGPELDGEVRINIDSDLQNDLEIQEVDVASVEQLIASSCLERNPNQSSFTRRGTGALPPTPDTGLPVWEIPDSSAIPQNDWQLGDPIVEATNLQPDSEGDLQIVATGGEAANQSNACYRNNPNRG